MILDINPHIRSVLDFLINDHVTRKVFSIFDHVTMEVQVKSSSSHGALDSECIDLIALLGVNVVFSYFRGLIK